ncbi:MAG: hypothetical protein HYZ75_03985 [Elusimicrobia bacterium]|nr:hypothetical protein [Elusimicrobiota bacterium]
MIAALLSLLLPLAATEVSAMPPTLKDADAKFAKNLYQEALALYDAVLSSGTAADRPSALWRACESEALLFRYGSAYERLRGSKLPGDGLWPARWLLLKAELGREYLKQYGHGQTEDEEEGADDAFRLSEDQLHAEVDAAFASLWERRAELAAAAVADESYTLEVDKSDRARYPTLLDFVVLRWTEYLLGEGVIDDDDRKPAAVSFLKEGYDGKVLREASPAALAAAVYEAAARLGGSGREAAAEIWRVRRARIPFAHGDKVAPFDDDAKGREAGAALLRRWWGVFKTPEGRAEAAVEAAELLNGLDRPDEAVKLCDEVVAGAAGTWGASRCAKLAAQIRMPELALSARVVPPPGKGALTLGARNLEKIHLRLYPVTPDELRASRERSGLEPWSNVLNTPSDEFVRAALARKPLKAWTSAPAPDRPHRHASAAVDLPDAAPGLHLVVASGDAAFKPGSSMLSAAVVNVTDLVMFGNSGFEGRDRDFIERPGEPGATLTAPAFRFYLLDGRTGRPVRGAALDLRRANNWSWRSESAATDELGRAELSETAPLSQNRHLNASADALARRGEHFAYWANVLSMYFTVPERFKVLVETDRPIYRPGQTVAYKVTVLERVPQGWKAHPGARVNVTASDPNGQQLYKEEKVLSALGSAADGFPIPAGRMLGDYHLSAELSDGKRSYSGYVSVGVEEYKRPEFEVTVEASTGAWRYGAEAVVSAKAAYYFGGPVPEAAVTYTVTREDWVPWWCWWWAWRPRGGSSEVLRGEAKTDADGRVSFEITPQPSDLDAKDPLPARFVVKVEARDAGGRTIAAERTFTAGAQGGLFRLTPDAGFASAGKPFAVSARLVSLDEAPLSGRGSWTLYRLDGEPLSAPPPAQWGGDFPASPSLDQAFRDVKDGPKAGSGILSLSRDAASAVALGSLAPGAYRLRVEASEPFGGTAQAEVVLIAVDPAKSVPLKLGAVAIPERAEYKVGETARFLIGSAFVDALTHVEVWGGQFLLERRALEGVGPRLVTVKLDERHKGGVSVRWFGVKDFGVRAGQAQVAVPWTEKRLKAGLTLKNILRPGQRASVGVRATGPGGKPVSGEATLRMYDRSLEYYAKGAGDPGLSDLYGARPGPGGVLGSQRAIYSMSLRVDQGWIAALVKLFRQHTVAPRPPGLRLSASRVFPRRMRMNALARGEMSMDLMEMEGGGGAAPAAAAAPSPSMAKEADGFSRQAEAAPPPIKARKDFSETAFFAPQVPVREGKGTHAFKVPERLTSYRVSGYVVTPLAAYGLVADEVEVRKDLMVRVEMPRYLREGDRSTLKALVNNMSGKPVRASVTVEILEDGKDAGARFGLGAGAREVEVAKDGTAALSWPVRAPQGVGSFVVRATARAGAEADAEERDLPLLPARQRLVESVMVALDADVTKTLTAGKLLKDDPSRQDELLQLQVDPQLALTVLNAIPSLVEYPYECIEQTLNRWLPAAATSKLYANHPAIAKAAAKVPKRDTINPAWEAEDPKRLQSLMETPWLQVSRGMKSAYPLVDMLDPSAVAATERAAFERLRGSQLGDGSFPWFPGGRGDPYMTLYVLAGMAQAKHFGVSVPDDMVARALKYAMNEVPRRLKPEEGDIAFILYASYAVTAFPGELPHKNIVKGWLEFAAKHDRAFTRLGHAYASYAWRRLGDRERAESYLDRAMDAARHDELTGTYWTPEKNSWLWYNDDLETHAFLIRALQGLRPEDKRLSGMVQWLLFNRKGSAWKSTKASAAAVFTLLDFMKKRGSLDKGDSFAVRWGASSDTAKIGPEDWLATPLRWTRTGQRSAEDAKAVVEKKGPGFAFASLTHVFSTTGLEESAAGGPIAVERAFFRRVKKGDKYALEALKSGDKVKVGDTVVVRLTLTSRAAMEYLHLKDPRGAGFEAETLRSGWAWDGLSRYEEPRDSLTNFFISWMPHGEYKLETRMRPTTAGRYRAGAAVVQSMYAPEFAAHSAGFELVVEE